MNEKPSLAWLLFCDFGILDAESHTQFLACPIFKYTMYFNPSASPLSSIFPSNLDPHFVPKQICVFLHLVRKKERKKQLALSHEKNKVFESSLFYLTLLSLVLSISP